MTLTGLLFLFSFAVTFILSVARHPIFGVIAYVSLVFLDPWSRWWGLALPDLRWSFLAIAATVGGLIIHKPEPPAVPITRHVPFLALLALLAWSLIQLLWVQDVETHLQWVNLLWKYALAMYLIYRCSDTDEHFLLLLWTFVTGCTYLAWVAHSYYQGGRFDDFGGTSIGEANAGALTLVCGAFIVASLFLASGAPGKALALFAMPLLLNALIMTISRSGFLALAAGGLTYIALSPRHLRPRVIFFSLIAVGVFVALTDPAYWQRIETVKYVGEDVQGMDTGSGRLDIMQAQVRMFRDHPLGCGHGCTTLMSSAYLDKETLNAALGQRASHNTFLSLLVDHGVVGALVYLWLAVWAFRSIRNLVRQAKSLPAYLSPLLPGIGACVAAQLAADQFVPFVRYEIRYWILTIVMILLTIAVGRRRSLDPSVASPALDLKRPDVGRSKAEAAANIGTLR